MDYLSREEYDRLSLASKDLVKLAGGPVRALEITGYKQAYQIQRCTTIEGQDRRFLPVKAIAELEADVVESGRVPPVTKVLADMAGFDLVRRTACRGDTSTLSSLSDLMKSFGEATGSVMDAYADGKLTAEEQEECIKRLDALLDQASRTLVILRGERVEG
ncbi:hypothetical protein [Labrenzia sp. OB1]|uniref:hypothetical protein n=1 Tax=Labrenzia sp. OB1 TaxID=1561204 RepID=UPI0007B2151E|nr:hypothetical protein [Labrenzia sp. OB1]KZM46956.1 hypothetical protein OA90_26550 [Labrenzia sp. OB1]